MITARFIVAGYLLAGSLHYLTGCGATDAPPSTYANNSCPDLLGWLYIRPTEQGEEPSGNLQFLSDGQLFIADETLFGGGGWVGTTCDEGVFHMDIAQEAYVLWTEDGFETLTLAPVGGESAALKFEFSEAF